MTGIDELRHAVRMLNNCNESFNQRYTAEQLILLYRAYKRSEWDIAPDQWTDEELQAALRGEGRGAESDDPARGDHGYLYAYETGDPLRPATREECEASDAYGTVMVDGRWCYVNFPP